MRRARIHYGKRFAVSGWFPSKAQIETADDRTEGLVGYFLSCAHRDDSSRWIDDLYTLARSCYLQGAMDTAMIAAQMRLKENHEAQRHGDRKS